MVELIQTIPSVVIWTRALLIAVLLFFGIHSMPAQESGSTEADVPANQQEDTIWKQLGLPEPNPDAPYANPPKLGLLFEDDFSTDTRGDFEIAGKERAVRWEPGKLTLGEGATLSRQLDGENWVELTLEIEFPVLAEDGQKSELKILLDLEPATDSYLLLRQERREGRTTSEIVVYDMPQADQNELALALPQKVRGKLLDKPLPIGRWKIEYYGGVWAVHGPGDSAPMLAYIENGYVIVVSANIAAKGQTTSITRLLARRVRQDAVERTPDEIGELERAVELNGQIASVDQSRFTDAHSLAVESLAIRQRLLGTFHPDVAISLANLASLRESLGRAVEAEPLNEQALEIWERLFPGDHPDIAISLNNLASVRQSLGRTGEAEPLLEQALEMYQRLFLGDHPNVAIGLSNLASVRQSLGRAGEAEPLLEQALEMYQRLFLVDHPNVAIGLSNLASVRKALGRASEAEPLYEQALAMHQRLFRGDHPNVASSLSNLASVRQFLGRAAEAEPQYEQALAMRERLFPGDHPDVASSLNNLAAVRVSLGRAAEAESLFEQALEMYQRLFSGDHPDVALSLNNLAYVRKSLGRAGEAEPLYEQVLAMLQRLFPGDHPDVAQSLNNLAEVRRSLGRAADAEPLHEQALAMYLRLFPGDHPRVAYSLFNLANVRRSLGRAADAEPLHEQALAMRKRLFPGDHPDVATSLNDLAAVRVSLGRAAEAESLFEQALEMAQRLFPDDHPDVATGLNNLADERESLGRVGDAEPLYEQALAMTQRLFPGDHPDVAHSLNNLADVRNSLGRTAEAEPLLEQALAMIERMRTEVRGEAVERAAYSGALNLSLTAQSFASVLVALDKTQQALEVLERGSTRAGLDLFAGGRGAAERAFRQSADETSLARYEAALIAETEARSALLETEARMGKAPDSDKKDWFEKVRVARATLSEKTSAVFNELRGLVPQVDPLSTSEILESLGDDRGLIAWAWVYAGPVVLVARNGEVHSFRLATGKEETAGLTERIAALRAWTSARPGSSSSENDPVVSAARDAVLPEAAREKLAGLKSLISVPDGPVQGIPLELLIPGFPIAYAPSATIAINRQRAAETRSEQRTGAVILGDPVFSDAVTVEKKYPETGVLLSMVEEGGNAGTAGLVRGDVLLRYGTTELKSAVDLASAIASAMENKDAQTISIRVWRDCQEIDLEVAPGKMGVIPSQTAPAEGLRSMAVLDRSGDLLSAEVSAVEQIRLYGVNLNSLPGTKLEVSAVVTMFGEEATPLVGPDATSPKLREAIESRPPRVLHLATHGLMGSASRPLLASLALTTPKVPTPEDTGFVTLEDIMSTWGARLKGTELVVLSACDTARGVQQGDTSMSLPLGLFVCGAETVIASQWKVDDTATALLMSRFYANWLGKTESERGVDGVKYAPGVALPKLAALREAKAWLRGLTREQVREILNAGSDQAGVEAITRITRGVDDDIDDRDTSQNPYAHPYYWSAFVLYGSPK